ncbi:MAG: hypothetical protein CML73_05745 [Rhodobiaceae bacterium]|nr:hypothetical protein [Rhodobiaceae bacterium]
MAAELRLNVALDLQYFKLQLPKLSQAAAGFQLPIQVKFDSGQVRKELNKLTGRRDFRINLNDTAIKNAISKVQTLKKALESVERQSKKVTATSTPIGTRQLSRTAGQGGFNAAEIQALYQQAATQGIAGFQKGIKVKRGDAVSELGRLAKDAVKGLISGLKKGKGQVGAASEDIAQELIDTMDARLEIRSPSRRLMKMGREAAKGFEIGISKGLDKAQQVAVARLAAMLIAMQQKARGFGLGAGSGQILSAGSGTASPAGMLTSASGRPRFKASSAQGLPGVRSALTGPSLYGQGRLALPPAGGSTASLSRASKETAATIRALGRSAERSASILGENDRVTGSGRPELPASSTGSALALRSPQQSQQASRGSRRGFSRFGPSGGEMFNNLKAGPIASIGKEFKYATSQVLLFGTAYKAIAAVTALPANIAAATANLQAFNNQMEAVTGGGQTMTNSMALIEKTVARFNVPVQSARDGFVKLFASMSPAGIDLSTINNVFTGLSAAASTFGMSADQVDRMTYALAQMASKGQIMTEELKGQLGDVFPQAVSLFAESAGFLDDSMDAQAKSKGLAAFLKALEDGALKGTAMSKVLANVGVNLNTKFGPTAEKAAGSFQNQMNKLNNALTKFHESFAPVAGAFLGEVATPMISALNGVGQAVKLAFSGEAITDNPLASYLRDELFPQLLNIKDALIEGAQVFGIFAQAAAVVLRPIAQFVLGNKDLVTTLVRTAATGMVLKAALVGLRVTGIIPLIGFVLKYGKTLRIIIAANIQGTASFGTLKGAAIASGMGMKQAAVGVRVLATAIRTVLVASAIGIALVAISALIGKIQALQATADSIKGQKRSYGNRLRKAAQRGGSEGFAIEQKNINQEVASRERGINLADRIMKGETISSEDRDHLEKLGGYESTLGGLRERKGGGFGTFMIGSGRQGESRIRAKNEDNIKGEQLNARRALTSSLSKYRQDTAAAGQDAKVVDARNENAAKVSLEGLGLDLNGDGSSGGGSATGRTPMSADELTIIQGINEKRREGNELAEAHLRFAQKLLEIRNSDADITEKQGDLDTARTDHALEIKQINEKAAKEKADTLKQETQNRQQIGQILLDQQLAAGIISQKEYDIAMHLRDQLATEQQLKELGATPEQIQQYHNNQGPAPGTFGDLQKNAKDGLNDLLDPTRQLDEVATGVGETFATMFTDLATGASTAQEALGSMFGNLSDMFANMVQEIIAQWVKVQLIQGLGSIFGGMMGGGGTQQSAAQQVGWPTARPYANGGMAYGGFTPFASGGIVKGPTLGLVGEGRHNEAIVPLPNGKSIPVDMGKGMGGDINSSVVVNISNGGGSESSTKGSQGNQLAKGIEGAVKDVIMREMRPGGMISSGR